MSNPDHFPLTPAFINPANFALMAIPLLPDAQLADLSQVSLPIIISGEKKAAPLSNNQMEAENKEQKNNQLIQDFEWISYLYEKKEINYVNDFVGKNDPSQINFKALDLPELEDVAIINVPKEFSSVAQDQYKRLLRFGGLDSNENIALKSGALEKEYYNDKYNDYYDLDDPWLNDDENHLRGNEQNNKETKDTKDNKDNQEKKNSKKMAIAEVYYKDFFATKGTLADFLKTPGYSDRMKLLDNFDNLMEKEGPNTEKRKRPEKERKISEGMAEKKQPTKKKTMKKVKTNINEVEFINSYPMNNPFLATAFPDNNNFVVSNMKFNPFACKNIITAPAGNIINNISPGIINDQFLEKMKNDQNLANFIDLNNLGSVGVELFNLLMNGNKLPPGFSLPPDFQLENLIKLPGIGENIEKNIGGEKNHKKKQRTLDFRNKNEPKKNNFPSNDNKNVYIEISENDDEPEKDKKI